jgi:hypothetical protein
MDRHKRTVAAPMKRPTLMPKVYRALVDISTLRDDVHGLGDDLALSEHEQQRLLSRLEKLETAALLLIDHFEIQQGVAAH